MVFRIPERHKGLVNYGYLAATLTKLTMGVTVVSNPLWITERALCLFR